ncbi:unnamed protein product [Cylicocyclus nassatus]|uniref:Uncharacterized protein n=1 Tax=Cylicocyclus nassatus TaxID=53992 RepID=A0AA36H3H5_CYLNA|nr:unnamed protein product [Cylicocyclus nassatus]
MKMNLHLAEYPFSAHHHHAVASRSPSQSRRLVSNTPSRRTLSSRRSPTPVSVVHSIDCTTDTGVGLLEIGYGWDDHFAGKDVQVEYDRAGYKRISLADASKRAYATTVYIYILTRHSDGKPQSTLLFAKAKLAPRFIAGLWRADYPQQQEDVKFITYGCYHVLPAVPNL